jgi:hypothetical protein
VCFDSKPDIFNYSRVGRKRINDEQTPARFPAGTLARIDAVLVEKEKRADLIRDAVEREIKRREQKSRPSARTRRNKPGA